MKLLTTAQVAKRLRLSTDTIHKWERHGLIKATAKLPGKTGAKLWDIDPIREVARARAADQQRRARQADAKRAGPKRFKHGERSSYVRGCRCEECCEANAQYIAAYRAKKGRKPRRKSA